MAASDYAVARQAARERLTEELVVAVFGRQVRRRGTTTA
jgi:hypothetical protein